MPRRRGWLRNVLEYAAAASVLAVLGALPATPSRRLAESMGSAIRVLLPRWRQVAARNLEIAFPDLPAREREEFSRESFRNLGRVLWALARMPRLHAANVQDVIAYDGHEHFENAKAAGKGVLFLTAHLGNWELSAFAHALMSEPMHVMIRALDNPYLDRLVDRRRRHSGNTTVDKFASAREVLRALRDNRAVGILADQNAAGDDGVFVDVFGIPASATSGVARLAARTGAPVIPGFAFWDETAGRHVLKFYPPIRLIAASNQEDAVRIHTQQCQRAIEEAVRSHPGQWLWMHRRWKSRPPGQPPVY